MSYVTEIQADSPVLWLRCQEASGLIQDSSGNARHATSSVGTATYQVTSPILSEPSDKAITYPDTAYFDIPDFDLADPNVMSVEAWVKRARTGVSDTIVTKGLDAYAFYFDSGSNRMKLDIYGGANLVLESGSTTDTAWHHFVATKNGAAVAMYKDGQDVTTAGAGSLVNNALTTRVGSNMDGNFFSGSIDELAIYDTALTQSRVQAHYNAGIASATATARFMSSPVRW